METHGNDSNVSVFDTKFSPNSDHTIQTSVYRKPTHTHCYLDWNFNHPISAKKAGIHSIIYTAKKVCTTSEILAKEMDYLHRGLLKNNYPDQMIKEPENKPPTPIISPDSGQKYKQNVCIFFPMFLASVRNLEESFNMPVYKSSSKEPTSLNLFLCILKITFHHN